MRKLFLPLFLLIGTVQCYSQSIPRVNSPLTPKPSLSVLSEHEKFFNKPTQINTVNTPYDFGPDTCFTYTFRLLVGNVNQRYQPEAMLATESGYTYQVGKVRMNGALEEGFLQKIDPQGRIIWSKTIGQLDVAENLECIKELNNGDLLIAGTIGFDLPTKRPMLIRCDTAGTMKWIKSLPPGYRGAALLVTKVDGYGIVGEGADDLLYARFNDDGDRQWMRKTKPSDNSKVIGFTNYNYSDWELGVGGQQNGRNIGSVLFIRPSDGTIHYHWKIGGATSNSDFIFHDMEKNNLRPRISGVYSEAGGPYSLFRITLNGPSIEMFEKFTLPGIILDNTSSSRLTDWAEIVAFQSSATSSDVHLINSYSDHGMTNDPYWAKTYNVGSFELKEIRRAYDGGNYIICDLAEQALLLKTDSTGQIPACNGQPITAQINLLYNYPFQSETLVSIDYPFPLSPENKIFLAEPPVDTSYQCRLLSCPQPPANDTCLQTFYRKFRGTTYSDVAWNLSVSPTNEILMTGLTRANPYDASTAAGMMIYFDNKGRIQRKKKAIFDQSSHFATHTWMKDGNLLIAGSTTHDGLSSNYSSPNSALRYHLYGAVRFVFLYMSISFSMLLNHPREIYF